jgi:hypothetical protein
MHSNIMSHRFLNVVFRMINFAIQKSLAAQLVVCLPFIHHSCVILVYKYIMNLIKKNKFKGAKVRGQNYKFVKIKGP